MKKLLLIWGIMIWGFTALQAKTAKDSASLYVPVGEPAAVDEQFRRNVAVGAAQLRHLLLSEETAQGGLYLIDFAAAMPAALAGETFIDHTPEKTLELNGKTYQVRQWAGSARTEVGQYLNKLNEQAALNGVKLFLGINLYLGETYRGHAISSYDPGTGLRSEKLQYGASQIARRFDSLMVAINQQANVPNARYVVLGRGLFVEEGTQLVGIWQHQANGVTLTVNTTLLKQGMNGQTLNEAAKTYLNALFSAVTGQALPWEYIAEGRFKDRSGKLNSSQRQEIETRTQELNTKLRAHGLEMTTVAVNATAKDSVIKEASSKNLQLGTDAPWQIEDVLVFSFLKSLQGNYDISCEKQKIKERMDKLRASPSYSTVYGSLPKFQKILYSTEAFFYNALISNLLCRFDAAKFEGSRAKYDSTGMSSGCTEAFIAGALYGVIEDFDVLTLAVDLEGLVKQQGGARLDMYLNYPAKLAAFRQKLTNIPQGKRLFEVVTAADIVSVLPPPIALQVTDAQAAIGMLEFLQKHYIQDASCWKSGQMAAMVVPVLVSGGVLLAAKAPQITARLTGRLAKNIAGQGRRLNFIQAITDGKKLEYQNVGKVEQIVVREGDAVQVYEKRADDLLHPLCILCFGKHTAVAGSEVEMAVIKPQQHVMAYTNQGQIQQGQVTAKVATTVSSYAQIWVNNEPIQAALEHPFKTSEGWKSAGSLQKGMLLFSLALNSYLPVERVVTIHAPLEVEGLSIGSAEGYGVGRSGILVAVSRKCPKKVRFTGAALDELATRLGSKYDEILELFDQLTPQGGHTLTFESGKLKLIGSDGITWVDDITSTQLIGSSGGGARNWNKFLNVKPPLMKNFEYVIDNNFRFKTDAYGRVEKITIDNLQLIPNKARDGNQQVLAKSLKDGKPTDNGGHMAGNQFGGPSEQINYHSQDFVSNQSGDWYRMETELKQLRRNNPTATIKVEIVAEFPNKTGQFGDPFRRPDRFDVEVKVNGTIFKEFDIPNP